MSAQIANIPREEFMGLISSKIIPTMDGDDLVKFNRCMQASTMFWGGMVDGKMLCIWGLVPPVLISDRAYLWLQILEDISAHEFLFVRHSQRAIEEALKHFPIITGHCRLGAEHSIRWIKWLGATFGEPEGNLVPFTIRKRVNG